MAATDVQAMYQLYFPVILEKCRRMLEDHQESQDVAQETFIRLWKSSLLPGDQRTVTAWIYRTSTRIAIDRIRQQRVRTEASAGSNTSALTGSAGQMEAAVQLQQMLGMLSQRVPKKELEIALLERIDGLSQQELAEVAGTSERTVRRLLRRFDAHLQELGQELGSHE